MQIIFAKMQIINENRVNNVHTNVFFYTFYRYLHGIIIIILRQKFYKTLKVDLYKVPPSMFFYYRT